MFDCLKIIVFLILSILEGIEVNETQKLVIFLFY